MELNILDIEGMYAQSNGRGAPSTIKMKVFMSTDSVESLFYKICEEYPERIEGWLNSTDITPKPDQGS